MRVVRLLKYVPRNGVGNGQSLPHAGKLRPLPWKQESQHGGYYAILEVNRETIRLDNV